MSLKAFLFEKKVLGLHLLKNYVIMQFGRIHFVFNNGHIFDYCYLPIYLPLRLQHHNLNQNHLQLLDLGSQLPPLPLDPQPSDPQTTISEDR